MPQTIVQKVLHTISSYNLFSSDDRLLLAVSGGIDSMVMLELMRITNYQISVAHCNFQLRSEASEGDEKLVRAYCEKHQIDFFCEHFDTKTLQIDSGKGIQELARDLRYHYFDRLVKSHDFKRVLTAHHLDDQLETQLMGLMDKQTIRAWVGIPIRRDRIVRPFLELTKSEIASYANTHSVPFREDASNAKLEYKRNKVRQRIVPLLKNEQAKLLSHVKNQSEEARALLMLFDAAYDKWLTEVQHENAWVSFPIKISFIDRLFVKELLRRKGFNTDQITICLAEKLGVGKVLNSDTHELLADRKLYILREKAKLTNCRSNAVDELLTIEEVPVNQVPSRFHPKEIFVDSSMIQGELMVRHWQKGDTFIPFGMKGRKKLSDFFVDNKINRFAKEKVWLLCDENNIIWIVNHRMDDRYKISSSTKKALKIKSLE